MRSVRYKRMAVSAGVGGDVVGADSGSDLGLDLVMGCDYEFEFGFSLAGVACCFGYRIVGSLV